ncbi:MAG: 50S ribosomal protein L28, partial [Pseudomonadota bacterium]|nr:50S ribosomal protein L28 [Pseudomonadota bacterium]
EKLGKALKFRISAHALRTVEHVGGIDAFLLKAKDAQLSPRALKLKKQIALRLAAS